MQQRIAENVATQIATQLAVWFRQQAPRQAANGPMKLCARRAFRRSCAIRATCRVVLLYGDDAGMIRDRAETLVRAVAGSLDDPFLVAELPREEIGACPTRRRRLSLTGGRRVVRVRDVTDAAAEPVQAMLKSEAPALVVLEGPALPARSKLRTAAGGGGRMVRRSAAIRRRGARWKRRSGRPCERIGVGIEPDALSWLSQQLGADRASTRAELEKLALYVGPGNRVDLDAAMTCVGDLAGLSLDDALFAATTGDVATADRALESGDRRRGRAGAGAARRAQASAAAASGAAGDGRAGADGGRRGQGAASAGLLPTVGAFTRALGLVVGGDADRSDGGAGRGRTRLQADRLAGSDAMPQRGADAGATIGRDISIGATIGARLESGSFHFLFNYR